MTVKRFLKFLLIAPLLFFFLYDREGILYATAVAAAVFLHECGHFCGFLLCGERKPFLRFHLLGITLTPRRMLSYGEEIAVSFLGPCFNFLTFAILFPLKHAFAFADLLSKISLLLSVCHLLPIIPLDGGRISFALCRSFFGADGERIAARLSFAALCVSLFFFLYFLLYYGIGSAPLFSVLLLFGEQEKHRFGF